MLKKIRTTAFDSPKGKQATHRRFPSDTLIDQLALGRAIIDNGLDENKAGDNEVHPKQPAANSNERGLGPIDETEPLIAPLDSQIKGPEGVVTYRERLGGFLHPRDMRKLVTPFSASNEPELIVRRHAMLLNFDPLRAIILRDRLLVLVPDGADSLLVQLEKGLRGGELLDFAHGDQESRVSLDEESKVSSHSSMVKNASYTNLSDYQGQGEGGDPEQDKSRTETTEPMGEVEGFEADETPYSIDLDENTQFVKSFVDNEWEELEGKEWIDLPFELQGVDAVLHNVCSILADEVLDLQLAANSMIEELLNPGADVGDHAQEVLRTMKNSVKEMMSRVEGFCRALDLLLEDYEDMALMNLSRLLTHPDRFIQPVPQAILEEESDEPELILEAHLQRGHTITNALSLVQGQINTTEDYAVRKSDTIRNRLLYINMMISVLSLSVAVASFVGSVFGMNVINHYEDSPTAFRVIVFSTIGGAIFFIGLIFLSVHKMGALPSVI